MSAPRRGGGRQRSGARRALSLFSMTAGAVLMVGGFAIRGGILGGPDGDPAASGDPTTPAVVLGDPNPGPTAAASDATDGSVQPSTEPPDDANLFFADAFDAEGAWPTGQAEFVTTDYDSGAYRLIAEPTDLPVYVTAATGGASTGPGTTVEADVWLSGDPESSGSGIGLMAASADGTRIVLLLDAGGNVALLRDSIESLDLLASGSVNESTGPLHLQLTLGSDGASALVDGALVASAAAPLVEPSEFGLAVWATGPQAVFWVDDYEVRAAG